MIFESIYFLIKKKSMLSTLTLEQFDTFYSKMLVKNKVINIK